MNDTHRLDDGEVVLPEVLQNAELAVGDWLLGLLEGIDALAETHEPDDVSADAVRHPLHPWVVPRFERRSPRQIEEVGMALAGDDLH